MGAMTIVKTPIDQTMLGVAPINPQTTPIPSNATETTKRPRDKTKLCKACQKIEQEEKPFQEFLNRKQRS